MKTSQVWSFLAKFALGGNRSKTPSPQHSPYILQKNPLPGHPPHDSPNSATSKGKQVLMTEFSFLSGRIKISALLPYGSAKIKKIRTRLHAPSLGT